MNVPKSYAPIFVFRILLLISINPKRKTTVVTQSWDWIYFCPSFYIIIIVKIIEVIPMYISFYLV